MKKMILIINPCSGQRKAKKVLTDIIDIFNRAGYTVLVGGILTLAPDGYVRRYA